MARISGRFVEAYGRLVLAESLHDAHFDCAEPVQDHGVDLVAFSGRSGKFVTIQLKAATGTRFSIDANFKRRAALIAYVFRCRTAEPEVFVLTYRQVFGIATKMKYTSLRRGQTRENTRLWSVESFAPCCSDTAPRPSAGGTCSEVLGPNLSPPPWNLLRFTRPREAGI